MKRWSHIWRHYPRLMQSIEEAHSQSAVGSRPASPLAGGQSAVQSRCAICETAISPLVPTAPGLCDACANKHGFAFVRGLEVGTAMLVKETDEVSRRYVAMARAAESRARAAIAHVGAAEQSLKEARRKEQLAKATAFYVGLAAVAWTALVWLMGR